jgi:16S rRNA (guanine527-N7)-methyltransferase
MHVCYPMPMPHEPRTFSLPSVSPLSAPRDFIDAAASLGIEFEEGDLPRLGHYLALLLDVNKTTNLTAVTDPAQAWTRHILDSLTLIPFLDELPEGATVLDVGSGGGLPGIPLAITMPRLRFTLLEATSKKAEFLRQVAEVIGLKNVAVVSARAERAAHDRGATVMHAGARAREGGHREKYDAVVARAVGRLATLAELVVPFAKVNGKCLLIKGQAAAEELGEAQKALHLLKATHLATHATPTGQIVVLDKASATPKDYPRADGEPKRAPLGVPRTAS